LQLDYGWQIYLDQALLSHNAKVYIAGRDREKAVRTIGALEAETGHKAIFLNLDLACLQSVKAAAAELASRETALHLLFNNAYVVLSNVAVNTPLTRLRIDSGVLAPPMDALTEEGYDLQWGTNVLGYARTGLRSCFPDNDPASVTFTSLNWFCPCFARVRPHLNSFHLFCI
jgi:NAD(P)-dependent dehydrogenase (short-subunit alcohol dehydrogenase family)